MNRVSFRSHCGFSDDFREAWVGMHGHSDLLWRAFDELGENAFGYEIRDLRSYSVHTEDKICLLVGDDLEEPVGLAFDERFADGPERELRLPDLVTLLFGLSLGEPERGHLGPTEGDTRNEVPVLGHRVLAGHVLDGDDAFVSGLVGEPETPDYVPCRVHAVLGRPPILIHLDDAALIYLDASRVEVEVFDDGLPSDGDEQRFSLQGVATGFAGLAGGQVFAAVPATLALSLLQALRVGFGAREHCYAAVLELLPERFGDLRVLQRHETVQDLDDGHLGAEVVVHAGELHADGTRAEDDHGFGVALVVGDDVV